MILSSRFVIMCEQKGDAKTCKILEFRPERQEGWGFSLCEISCFGPFYGPVYYYLSGYWLDTAINSYSNI